jgi:hypothetical protein
LNSIKPVSKFPYLLALRARSGFQGSVPAPSSSPPALPGSLVSVPFSVPLPRPPVHDPSAHRVTDEEEVTLSLVASPAYLLGTPSGATITIDDDD